MILNKLNQYKNLYLQASNENAHLKHAVSKHEDELEANRKTIESMDSRILELEDKPDKYKVEYIHAALSLEKKMVVMLYGEGSRSHTIPEEQIFEHSNIKYFTADRAKLYDTVVKNMEEKYGIEIKRSACWFHARHYFVDAFIADHRVRTIIKLMNYLFYIERVANEKNKRGKA